MPANKRIDDYIAGYDGEIKRRLEQIYAVIAKVMPSAEQTVSYSMPTFKLSGKNAIHFAAAKHHIGLYPSPEAVEYFADSLLGYKTSKGAIQFQNNQPLPLELIQKIAEHRRAKLTGGTSTMKSTRQERRVKYVVLLRGVNAGGKRRMPMAELRQLLGAMDFHNVRTYINSGNAIFESVKRPNAAEIQQKLETHFGFDIDTLLLDEPTFSRIVQAIPSDWKNDYTDHRADVCFLFADVDVPAVIDTIKPNHKYETVFYKPGAVYSHFERKNYTKTSLQKIVGNELYKRMTIRNTTTARRLLEMIEDNGSVKYG